MTENDVTHCSACGKKTSSSYKIQRLRNKNELEEITYCWPCYKAIMGV